jgi:exonuclease SbcD
MNISVRGVVKRDADNQIDPQHLIIPLSHKGQTYAWCMAVPYLRQGDYPPAQTHAEGIKSMYDLLHQHVEKLNVNKLPIIAMGHLQATGSELSENDRSERSIIGGLECVSPEAFDKQGIVYTALGHLHKPQRVSGREHVRYAGSPLPMSFSEKNYKQGVNLIYVDNNKLESIERIDFTPPIRLISLPKQPKPLQEVLDEIALLPDGEIDAQSPYLELKVLITQPEPSMRNQLEEALRNKAVRLTSAVPYRLKTNRETNTIGYEELKTINPMSLAENFYQSKYATPMPNSIKTLLQAVIQEAQL